MTNMHRDIAKVVVPVMLTSTVLLVQQFSSTFLQVWFKEQSQEVCCQKRLQCQLATGNYQWATLVPLVSTARRELMRRSIVLQELIVTIRTVKMLVTAVFASQEHIVQSRALRSHFPVDMESSVQKVPSSNLTVQEVHTT